MEETRKRREAFTPPAHASKNVPRSEVIGVFDKGSDLCLKDRASGGGGGGGRRRGVMAAAAPNGPPLKCRIDYSDRLAFS